MNETKKKILKSKALEILSRVDIASRGQHNTDNWDCAKDNASAPDGMSYNDWIDEAETDLIRFIDEL